MKLLPFDVYIPLLNPNEPEALLSALHVHEGQHVSEGDLLCTLETTKSVSDLAAEATGYVVGLRFSQGQTVSAGEVFCSLAESLEWRPAKEEMSHPDTITLDQDLPAGLRITQPALLLARQNDLDLHQLPVGPLVTEKLVRAAIKGSPARLNITAPATNFDPIAILVYGGGGHGKMLIDLLKVLGTYRIVGVVDDGKQVGETILGVTILGGGAVLEEVYRHGVRLAVNAVGGVGNVQVRIQVFQRLAQAGFGFPVVIHPTAYVEPSAVLSPGAQVLAHAYVGSEAQIGFGSIINTGSIVSHDCILGDFTNVSPGAMLAGEVSTGSGVLIGMGVTVNLRVKIGAGARIGNGATVKADVFENGVVRAGTIWPI
jgi:acetyltransferase EpsM